MAVIVGVGVQSRFTRPGRHGRGRDAMKSIRTLLLELVDEHGASHIRELHIEILRDKPGTPEHTVQSAQFGSAGLPAPLQHRWKIPKSDWSTSRSPSKSGEMIRPVGVTMHPAGSRAGS